MSFNNPLFMPLESYKRDFDLIGNYEKSIATYLSSVRKMSYEQALEYVKRKNIEPQSPSMKMLRRKPRQDRKKTEGDLLSYLKWINKNDHILTPNLVCYANPKIETSFVAGFIDVNLENRGKVKHAGFVAEQDGDQVYADFCNLLQANYKIRNNSISGATSSPHNALYYGSAHTSLTSFCRAITSTANAINEKGLSSNRHYFSPLVTIENILYLARNSNLPLIQEAIYEYDLEVPTVDYVYNQVLESTRKYWKSDLEEQRIRNLLEGLDSLALTAVSLTNDLRALTETNDRFMRDLYTRLMHMPKKTIDEPKKVIKSTDGDVRAMVSMLSSEFIAGIKPDKLAEDDPELHGRFANRMEYVSRTLESYELFFKAFITTDNMPSHLHSLPSMVRDSVIASDTDSSIFSMQRQVEWFTGKKEPGPKAMSIAAITSYIISQNIAHNLGMLCAQIGVESRQLFRCTMKGEFFFPVMVVTTRTKHYMALIRACEGNVYKENKSEIKGVNLKNSKLPPLIRGMLKDYQVELMEMVARNQEIVPLNVISPLACIEHKILETIRNGDATYYRYEQAKTKETYARPESSNFQKIQLWNDVFGSRFGYAEELPAPCVKIPVKLPKMKDIEAWAATLDEVSGKALLDHCHRWGKSNFTNLLVPADMLVDDKIPSVLLPIIDDRKILRSMMQPFYITAECYGLYCLNKRDTRFYSDQYTYDQVKDYSIIDLSGL